MITRSSKKNRPGRKPIALLVAAHPIWNVPPFVNAALELTRHGYSVIVLGYQARKLPRFERAGPGAMILRIPLASRKIRWTAPRKVLAVFEFLIRARAATMKIRPDVLITFNDPASILHKCTGAADSMKRVSWLLEYPELERLDFGSRLLMRLSASCWEAAQTIVVPTRERLALHLALRPACSRRKTLVIQNAPRDEPSPQRGSSERTEEALRWLQDGDSDCVRIVYSGAIGNRYAVDNLIRTAGSFPDKIRLLLLGQKHPLAESEVAAALRAIPFPENIHWIDEIPYRELSTVLQSCDAGFATYHGDTLNTRFAAPGKLYEYLKNGLVILSDEDCCVYGDTKAARCGFFFPKPVTDEGVRGALATLLNSRHNLKEMKLSALRLFQSRLNMERQIAPLIPELTGRPAAAKRGPLPKSLPRRKRVPALSFPAERRP